MASNCFWLGGGFRRAGDFEAGDQTEKLDSEDAETDTEMLGGMILSKHKGATWAFDVFLTTHGQMESSELFGWLAQ